MNLSDSILYKNILNSMYTGTLLLAVGNFHFLRNGNSYDGEFLSPVNFIGFFNQPFFYLSFSLTVLVHMMPLHPALFTNLPQISHSWPLVYLPLPLVDLSFSISHYLPLTIYQSFSSSLPMPLSFTHDLPLSIFRSLL